MLLRTWPDRRVTVERVLPRRTALVRRTAGKDATGQVLAANLDAAAVVEPVDPAPDVGRIERLLALAYESGARPLVVLTKADLAADPAAMARQLAGSRPGCRCCRSAPNAASASTRCAPHVAPGRTLGLLGPSGAGKSSLVNALAGAVVMPTQAIRRVDGKGRHTTTWRALIPIPGGGAVLDTPGVRAVGLLDGAAGLDRAFADIDALAHRLPVRRLRARRRAGLRGPGRHRRRGADRPPVRQLASAAPGAGLRDPAAGAGGRRAPGRPAGAPRRRP